MRALILLTNSSFHTNSPSSLKLCGKTGCSVEGCPEDLLLCDYYIASDEPDEGRSVPGQRNMRPTIRCAIGVCARNAM